MGHKIHNNIARFRKDQNWSQADLAARLNISITQLSRLERGVSSLSQRRMSEIASALGVKPVDLFLSHQPREEVDLRVIRDVIVQLDQLFEILGIEPTPEQRADLTVEIYRLETDGLDPEAVEAKAVDLKKYEGMLKSMMKG